MPSAGIIDLIKRLSQFPLTAKVEHGTLQYLAITAIANAYSDYREKWISSMPYVPKKLRKEICKRLMYKGQIDNDLFSLCVDSETRRGVWDLRSTRENFNDQSCSILSRVGCMEVLRLSHTSCSATAMGNMIQNFGRLRLLEIIYTKALNDSVIEKLVEYCPSLEVLNVKATSITDKAMLLLGTASLRLSELDISYTNVSETGIHHLSNGAMKNTLKLLRFNRCPLLGDCTIIRDIILSFPNLKDYSFNFNSGDDEGIGWVLDQLPQPTSGQNVSFNIPI